MKSIFVLILGCIFKLQGLYFLGKLKKNICNLTITSEKPRILLNETNSKGILKF